MKARTVVVVLVVVLAIYMGFLVQRAVDLIQTGRVAAIGLGVGVLLLPIIGVVLVVFELRFGAASARLARRLADERTLPATEDLPRRPSGRVERSAADEHFETVRRQVEAAPDDWRRWYALGDAYNLAGDRRRARSALRRAIELAEPSAR